MDPAIWGNLPWDLIERIAHFADIDSRRALGFKPRKLPKTDLKIWYPNLNKYWRQVGGDMLWFQILGPKKILHTGKAICNNGEVYYWHNYELLKE
jgi:hypothetical protein